MKQEEMDSIKKNIQNTTFGACVLVAMFTINAALSFSAYKAMETIRAKSTDRAYMGALSQKFVDACRKTLPVAAPEEKIGYCAKNKAQEAVEKGTEELRKAGVTFGGFGLCFLIMARSVWAMRSKFKEAIAKPEVR